MNFNCSSLFYLFCRKGPPLQRRWRMALSLLHTSRQESRNNFKQTGLVKRGTGMLLIVAPPDDLRLSLCAPQGLCTLFSLMTPDAKAVPFVFPMQKECAVFTPLSDHQIDGISIVPWRVDLNMKSGNAPCYPAVPTASRN